MNEWYVLIHDDHAKEVETVLRDLFQKDKIRYLVRDSQIDAITALCELCRRCPVCYRLMKGSECIGCNGYYAECNCKKLTKMEIINGELQ